MSHSLRNHKKRSAGNWRGIRIGVHLGLWMLVAVLLPGHLYSQQLKETSSVSRDQYETLMHSVDAAVVSEQENTEKLKAQLDKAKSTAKKIAVDLNAYQAQLSSHGNLLLLPETGIEALEKAKAENLATAKEVSLQIKQLKEMLDAANQSQKLADEQQALNEKQFAEIKQYGQKDETTQTLSKNLRNLLGLISTKKKLLDSIATEQTKQIRALEETEQAFLATAEKLDRQIKDKKRKALFRRKPAAISLLTYDRLAEDVRDVMATVALLFTAEEWQAQIQAAKDAGAVQFFVPATLLVGVLLLLRRLQNVCIRVSESMEVDRFAWRKRALEIFTQSLFLIGITLFLYILGSTRLSALDPSNTRILLYALTAWLSTAWWFHFLKILTREENSQISAILSNYLMFLVHLARYFVLVYLVVAWMIGAERTILILGRMVFETVLFLWYVIFIRDLRRTALQATQLPSTVRFFLHSFLPMVGYLIFGGGLLLDLVGYKSFALYWDLSWGRTAIIFLWGYLLFQVLHEWGSHLRQTADVRLDEAAPLAYPVRWFINRLCWLFWLAALVLSNSFAWGARQAIIVSSVRLLNEEIRIGSLTFSLMSLMIAFLILFLTLAGSRIWRNILNKKILTESVLEPGLKESIETISVYLFWGVGMVIALNAMGVSSTSLAVVFGALSIGLGFGLQNIFNNFVSGIILLFERPIQVGDAVELNGIWGEVKKINVRATVVQTYDNASLIIPNSEFISSQVTNWSFKDLRLRRKITVGVAYGSDIELVRKTLLEVADGNQMVLKVPKPDVLFSDFGDSALIFVLRIWTDVNRMLICETAIRFEIDRLFRERGIEISFPQRDIHIRTITEKDNLSIRS